MNQGAQSAHHQRSAAPPQRGKIYTQRCQSLFLICTHTQPHRPHTYTDTHIRSHSVFTLTAQSGALASEECLSQSVTSRCVSIDNCCVKYYNKQNSKMVLACQQLPYFNRVCRPLAEMENFPMKQKAPYASSVIEQCNCRVSRSFPATKRPLCEDLTNISNLPH